MSKTLLTEFKELKFSRHPVTPCVVLMYDQEQLTGLIVIETDDLLGGGIGPKFADALQRLRKRFNFGSWNSLQEKPIQYGGRTIFQRKDYGFEISMMRYLKSKAMLEVRKMMNLQTFMKSPQ